MGRKLHDFEIDAHKVEPDPAIIKALQDFVDTHDMTDDCLLRTDLIQEEYIGDFVGQSDWYFHPDLLDILPAYKLSRYAMLLNMRQHRDSTNNTTISHFIFTQDKEREIKARGISHNHFDRFDAFRCTPDGRGGFRKNGTMKGPMMVSQGRRDRNKIFLHILMYGKFIKGNNLRCAYTNENVENLQTVDDNENITKFVDIYDLHHSYYVAGASVDKTDGPSKYLNKQSFENFSHDVIIELLGCIVLSENSHTRIHKTQREDDITGWFKKLTRGDVCYIPFHWQNEENYLNTLSVLAGMCPRFDLARAPSYHEFLAKNTSSKNLPALLPGYIPPPPVRPIESIFSTIFGYEDCSKIDPNLQNTIPCILADALLESQGLMDIKPIYLFD